MNVTWWPGLKTKFRGNFIVGWYLPAVKTGTKCLLDNYFWKENLQLQECNNQTWNDKGARGLKSCEEACM